MEVKFYKIDSWNRPVFKAVERKMFFGCTGKLFPYNAELDHVKQMIDSDDLVYFGSRFDCEPLGTLPIEELKILW